MIFAEPTATAVTMPDDGTIVAILVLLLLHVPPGTVLPSVTVLPMHMVVVPVMEDSGLTVTISVIAHPPEVL